MKKIFILFLIFLPCFVQTGYSINGLWLEKHDGTRVGYIFDNISHVEYSLKGISIVTYQKVDEYTFEEVRKIYFADDIVLRGDANGDGMISWSDVAYIVNYILGTPADNFNAEAADVNQDGKVGIQDIMFIVNHMQNGKYPDE